jgi:hypothetical protein
MPRTISLIALLLLAFTPVIAQKSAAPPQKPEAKKEAPATVQTGPQTGVVYGPGHAFSLDAPEQWVLDNQSGVDQGLQAVFYPVGKSWTNSPTVMYANVYLKKDQKAENAATVAAKDIADFRKHSGKLNVLDADPLPLGDPANDQPRKALVKYFSGDDFGNFEAVAYINESSVVVMLVLSARKEDEFKKALPAFAELVRSYRFLTDKVISD